MDVGSEAIAVRDPAQQIECGESLERCRGDTHDGRTPTAGFDLAGFLQEDLKIREGIQDRYSEAAVSTVEIERQANKVSITIYTARPGIVIGRGGQRV